MAETTAGDVHEISVGATPMGSPGRKSSGWYGMLTLILTEAALFLYLQFSYYYMALWNEGGFLPREFPSLKFSAPDTAILLVSSLAVWWAERGAKKGSRGQLAGGLAIALLLGAVFMGIQVLEWLDKPFRWDSDPYGSLYFVITGLHMAHVLVGLLILFALFVWALLGFFDPKRHAPVTIGAVYWHFVDVVWLTIFFTFYISPYLS